MPLVPGFNDSEDNLTKLCRLGREIGAEKVSILPYHKLAEEKYRQLGRQYTMSHIQTPNREHLQQVRELIESYGLQVTIGS